MYVLTYTYIMCIIININQFKRLNMTFTYDSNAKKKATNLTINSDLLRIAKELKINLSSSFETFLAQRLKEHQTLVWMQENKDAIEQYNKDVETNGVFSDGLRSF